MENNYCVYCHTNKINGKKYIGITKYGDNPERRWRYGTGYNPEKGFGGAIQKYGWDNFTHEILKEHLTKEEANYWEKYYIKKYHTWIEDPLCQGYNLTSGGDGISDPSEETREKMRQNTKALWQNEEYRKKILKLARNILGLKNIEKTLVML